MSQEPEDNGVPTDPEARPLDTLAEKEAEIAAQQGTIDRLQAELTRLRHALPQRRRATDPLGDVARTAGRVALSPVGMTAIAVAVGGIVATQVIDTRGRRDGN